MNGARSASLAGALACLLLAGCSISSLDELSGGKPSVNECEDSSECATGVCSAGLCQAKTGAFQTVLFEVLPPSTAGAYAGARYLQTLGDLPVKGGPIALALDDVATVSGSVTFTQPSYASGGPCTFNSAADTKLAIDVRFTPSARVLGLSAVSYKASAPVDAAGNASTRFSVSMPPGEYDIYVQPTGLDPTLPVGAGSGCPLVPQLYRQQPIQSGKLDLPLELAAPSLLHVRIVWPVTASQSLQGWSVDLLDAKSGHVLATPVKLGAASGDGFAADVAYLPVIGDDKLVAGSELVRLSPPPDVVAPTILWERAGLELFNAGQALVDQLTAMPTPVQFEGRVVDAAGDPVVGASVSVVATALDGIPAGTLAAYSQEDLPTDAAGKVALALLPGTYRVFAVPPAESGLAAAEGTWSASTVAFQAGQELRLSDPVSIRGGVSVAWGPGVLTGASVHALVAASAEQASVLDRVLGHAPFIPRASVGSVDARGDFAIHADPAVFDVSIRPQDGTGFAWVVRPNVAATSAEPSLALGTMEMPLPVVYQGSVGATSTPIADALIRAYLYMDSAQAYTSDPGSAATVVQVAETRADADARFTLLLPAHLD